MHSLHQQMGDYISFLNSVYKAQELGLELVHNDNVISNITSSPLGEHTVEAQCWAIRTFDGVETTHVVTVLTSKQAEDICNTISNGHTDPEVTEVVQQLAPKTLTRDMLLQFIAVREQEQWVEKMTSSIGQMAPTEDNKAQEQKSQDNAPTKLLTKPRKPRKSVSKAAKVSKRNTQRKRK